MTDATLLEPGWTESDRDLGGIRLHVVEAGDPSDPLVILLHGFPEFWWTWHRIIPGVAAAGFHVVVPDQRGYNLSEVPRGVQSYDLDALAADVVALADSFRAPRFHLVGHDWGAVVTWWAATRFPERVLSAVPIASPLPGTFQAEMVRHPSQMARSAYAGFFQLPALPEVTLRAAGFTALRAMMERTARPDTFEPGELDRYARAWARPRSLSGMLSYYRALARRRFSRTTRVRPPALVIWAEHDSALRRGLAERSVARCEDGRLVVVPGTSHWLQLEEPERLLAEVVPFLRAAADPRGGSTTAR